MALTPPTVEEFETFVQETFPEDEQNSITTVLQGATDALWVFTGIEEYPADDPRLTRIIKNAILDLTAWLRTQYDHREEINSPFNSERIGSYSYSKIQQSSQSGDSGIWWLDMLFRALRAPGADGAGVFGVSSEFVFNPGGLTYADMRRLEKQGYPRDPSEPWGF